MHKVTFIMLTNFGWFIFIVNISIASSLSFEVIWTVYWEFEHLFFITLLYCLYLLSHKKYEDNRITFWTVIQVNWITNLYLKFEGIRNICHHMYMILNIIGMLSVSMNSTFDNEHHGRLNSSHPPTIHFSILCGKK
jgi:hypothetical protein